jgi:hypothetical protein
MGRLGLAFLLALFGADAVAEGIEFRPAVNLDRPQVRLGDVADLAPLPPALRPKASSLIVGWLDRGAEARFSANEVAARARALMPALGPWLPPELASGAQTIDVRLRSDRTEQDFVLATCLRAMRTVAAGDVGSVADFTPVACTGRASQRAFRYDTAIGALRVERRLEAGEVVWGAPRAALVIVTPGEPLYLSARVGPVEVVRQVRAVQSAKQGEALFVRADDGSVFAARGPTAP